MNEYFLIFNSHFDRDKGLDVGRLSICSIESGTIQIWMAASSHSTKQYPESFHERGGYLPPEYRVPGLNNWTVDTRPVDLTHVKGVEGNFYRIEPFEVQTDRGTTRSDFGIHLDANAPGSLGCIVMSGDRFSSFEQWMKTLRMNSCKKLPLFVHYS